MSKLFFYELIILARGNAFRMALVVLAGLLVFAAVHQSSALSNQEADIAAVMEETQNARDQAEAGIIAVERGEERYSSLWQDPRGYYTWNRDVLRYPESPTSFLAVGQRDLYEPLARVDIFKPAQASGRDLSNPLAGLLGAFDPAFVLVFLLPLFLIGFNQGILSREREAGTLPMLLMRPGGFKSLLLVKALPRLLIPILLTSVVLILLFPIAGQNPLEHGAALLWLLGLTTGYICFWFLVTLLFNFWFRGSQAHALAMVSLWAMVCVLLPSGISTLSKYLYPIPAASERINNQRSASNELQAKAQEILAEYYHDHPELAATKETADEFKSYFAFYRSSLTVGMEVEGAIQPTKDHQQEQQQKQQRLEQALGYSSPAVLFAGALETLAGHSGRQYADFDQAVSSYSRHWRSWFQAKAFEGTLFSTDDIKDLPSFEHSIDARTGDQAVRLGTLWVLNLILIGAIALRLRGRAAYDLM